MFDSNKISSQKLYFGMTESEPSNPGRIVRLYHLQEELTPPNHFVIEKPNGAMYFIAEKDGQEMIKRFLDYYKNMSNIEDRNENT